MSATEMSFLQARGILERAQLESVHQLDDTPPLFAPKMLDGFSGVQINRHEIRVLARAAKMNWLDKRRLTISTKMGLPHSEEEYIIKPHVEIAPRSLNPFARRRHTIEFEFSPEGLKKPEAPEVIRRVVNETMLHASHNMIHQHNRRFYGEHGTLLGVGVGARLLMYAADVDLPNILETTVHTPIQWLPTALQNIHYGTEFFAAVALGFAAQWLVRQVGEVVHEWRADRRFKKFDRITAKRQNPAIAIVPLHAQLAPQA